MKKLLSGVMTLGLAAMLSAAPQTGQTATPDPNQAAQGGGKHNKRTGKKHRTNPSGHAGRKGKSQHGATNPGN